MFLTVSNPRIPFLGPIRSVHQFKGSLRSANRLPTLRNRNAHRESWCAGFSCKNAEVQAAVGSRVFVAVTSWL